MILDKKNKARIFVFSGFFILGVLGGFFYIWLNNKPLELTTYNASNLTNNLTFAKVEEGQLKCKVLLDNTAMYNNPSVLEGKVIEHLSKGVNVNYLGTVSSNDKSDKYAVTNVEMQFQWFWGRKHIIPMGTKVTIIDRYFSEDSIIGQVYIDDKYYEKEFSKQYLNFPYLGQWKKVEFLGKEGYIQYAALSDEKIL